MRYLRDKDYINKTVRVRPKAELFKSTLPESVDIVLPLLLKRYLNIGVKICGEPCLDVKFNVADIFVLVDIKKSATTIIVITLSLHCDWYSNFCP